MNTNLLNNKKVAIIVGSGDLPLEVIKSVKRLGITFAIIRFNGVPSNIFINENVIDAKFEQIAELFTELIFSSILKLFNNMSLNPMSVSELAPNLYPYEEFLTKCKPGSTDILDSQRSEEILTIMSSADLGQSLIVSKGVCLAIETVPGTDAMLNFISNVRKIDNSHSRGGILYKGPKNGQNSFIDAPVIGEVTIKGVKEAGLNGIVIKHSKVIVLNQNKTKKLADNLGVFIWSKK